MPDSYIQDRARIVTLLHKRGWLPQYATAAEALDLLDRPTFEHAIAEYQAQMGAGDVETSLEAPRFCALPDRMAVRGQICRWPNPNITWTIVGNLPRDAAEVAFGFWAAVCGIKPKFVAGPSANVVMTSANLGGAGGVLAESELPCGVNQNAQLRQRYDTSEHWVNAEHPSGGQIDIVRVMCHELGHALGMDHINSGNLLAPMYSPNIRRPQQGDIAEMVRRYGPPVVQPPPTPVPTPIPPPAGDVQEVVIRFKGEMISATIPGYRVIKNA